MLVVSLLFRNNILLVYFIISDCEFTQDDVCQNLNNNVVITKPENGKTLLTIKGYDSGTYNLLSREPTKDRYLTTEKTRYNFNNDTQIISALIEILKDQNNRVLHIYDSDHDQNYEHKKITYEAESGDITRFNTQRLNKDFFIKITDALKAYCKLPTDPEGSRFNMETFQKAIQAVDVLYPGINLYDAVFPSSSGCSVMGGRKSRKTRKQRKARKTRKSRRTKRRTRRTRK